jgi:hypothetical protein
VSGEAKEHSREVLEEHGVNPDERKRRGASNEPGKARTNQERGLKA